MSEAYSRVKYEYFPDFADWITRDKVGTTTTETKNLNIISHPMVWTNSLTGIKNPSWRSQVRVGTDASTPMQASVQSVAAKRMTMSFITQDVAGSPSDHREQRWEGYPLYSIPSLDSAGASTISAARNLALRKFIQRAEAARTSVEGGEFIGEWKETVQAITNPLAALRNFTTRHVIGAKKRLRRLKNSRSGGSRGSQHGPRNRDPAGKALTKALSDTYLEFVFGWVPLASDVKAAVNGLLDRYNQPDYQLVNAKAVVAYNPSDTMSDVIFTSDGLQLVRNFSTSSAVDYRFRASIRTGAVNGVRSVSATLGLLPERFLPTIWELIPYSFVVDYFVNIGDIIESFAFQSSNIRWGTRVIRIKTERKYGAPYLRNDPGLPADYIPRIKRILRQGVIGGDAITTRMSIDRVPIDQDYLMPDLSIHLPISAKPWVNLGAVLTQKFCSL